jgi:hypothetical protein
MPNSTTHFHSARSAARALGIPLYEVLELAKEIGAGRTGRTLSLTDTDLTKIAQAKLARLEADLYGAQGKVRELQRRSVAQLVTIARLCHMPEAQARMGAEARRYLAELDAALAEAGVDRGQPAASTPPDVASIWNAKASKFYGSAGHLRADGAATKLLKLI